MTKLIQLFTCFYKQIALKKIKVNWRDQIIIYYDRATPTRIMELFLEIVRCEMNFDEMFR